MLNFLEKNEYKIAIIVIVFIAVIFNLGFITALLGQGYENFTGVIGVARGDKSVYISMIEQVRQGGVINYNLFTSENQGYGLFHPLWLVLGATAKFFDLSSFEIFHIVKFFSIIVFLLFLYFIAREFFSTVVYRLIFLFGLAFFGGVGRLVMLFSDFSILNGDLFFKLIPVDVWYSEGFSFLTLYHSPLFIIAQLLMVLAWWFVLLFLKNKKIKYSIFAGIVVFLLGLIHPFDIFGWWAVIISLIVISLIGKSVNWKNAFKALCPSVIASVIVVGYYGFLLVNESVLSAWNSQNNMPAPSFFSMLTGYGFLWILSIVGLFYIVKNKTGIIWDWLVVWFLTFPLLLFVPINISRRLLSSFGIVIIIMSVFGIEYIWSKIKFKSKIFFIKETIGIVILFLLLVLSPVYQIVESVYEIRQGSFPVYLNISEKNIIHFLKTAPKYSVVLAEPFFANSIPALTGRYVWLGHDVQTVAFEEKKKKLYQFYTMPWSRWHEQFVKENGIDYVIWPSDRLLEIPSYVDVRLKTKKYLLLSF